MPDYFASPRRKLARAKAYISDLESKCSRFIDEHAWTGPVEINPNPFGTNRPHKEFKITLNQAFPDIFSDITANAISNLRSTLDHLGYAAAKCSGVIVPRNAAFPFGDTPVNFENAIKGRCKDIPPDIVAMIRTFHPYKTQDGNVLLCAINDIANLDKHAIVTPIGVRPVADTALNVTGTIPGFLYRWNAADNEIIYRVLWSQADDNLRVALDIGFGEIPNMTGKPVTGLLHAMAYEVENILVALEAECRILFPNAF